MALIKKLENIGNAIREKTGKTDLLTLEQMVTEIEAIETGGGSGELPEEAYLITGSCDYKFSHDGWSWFIREYGDKVTTEDILSAGYMFYYCNKIEEIPFDLNFKGDAYRDMSQMFCQSQKLKKIGKIINAYPSNMGSMFTNCRCLRELPEFINPNFSRIQTYAYASVGSLFQYCCSLRRIPEELLKQLYNSAATSVYSTFFNNCFYECNALDEIVGLNPTTATMTSNFFNNTFMNCMRVKNIIFATQEDGTPYIVQWKNQSIILASNIGYHANGTYYLTQFDSGITEDKKVFDDASYQALKDDPDWYTHDAAYSRYNHDSAVNTINSLPDTSAYLAANGGTNTIKFYGVSGEKTDGGAINTLTEEEIAVAAAKGWTVTLI